MLQTTLNVVPRMTAGLGLSIALLPLTSLAVMARAALVASENPALRIVQPQGGQGRRPLLGPEEIAAREDSLIGHVLRQIGQLGLSPRHRVLALALSEALEPTGWLGAELGQLARDCGVPLAEMEIVLQRLQTLEPSGIFARSLSECLRLQAIDAGQATAAVLAVLSRLPLLAAGNLPDLARDSGLSDDAIHKAVRQIRALNPKPGLLFSGPMPPAFPPDLVARRTRVGWIAERHPALPRLEVRRAMGDPRTARLWQQAVERRAELGRVIASLILERQRAFLDGTGDLCALTSAELADATGVHVATVNRVVKGTTVATPSGTGPLRGWMARPLKSAGGPSAAAVKQGLARLLEDPAHAALSDARLALLLALAGLHVARRTVAKYRSQLVGQRPGRPDVPQP